MRRPAVLPVLLLCAAAGSSQAAWAALGGTLDTAQAGNAPLRETRRVASHDGYEVHETVLASGTVVREFTGPTGLVFAVTWQGPIKPDLNQLLGIHFSRLVVAGESPHADHRSLRLRDADLVIESVGKMRAFAGRAYLPAMLPAGVAAGDIR